MQLSFYKANAGTVAINPEAENAIEQMAECAGANAYFASKADAEEFLAEARELAHAIWGPDAKVTAPAKQNEEITRSKVRIGALPVTALDSLWKVGLTNGKSISKRVDSATIRDILAARRSQQ